MFLLSRSSGSPEKEENSQEDGGKRRESFSGIFDQGRRSSAFAFVAESPDTQKDESTSGEMRRDSFNGLFKRRESLDGSEAVQQERSSSASLGFRDSFQSIGENIKGIKKKVGEVVTTIQQQHNNNPQVIDMAEKQMLLARMNTLLDNLRLQCPQSHAGVVVAYSSATYSPLSHSGIIFSWYRTGGHGSSQFTQVQRGYSPFYTPCADDIGHRICLQCQDTFGEGYSRYIESDPIMADKLLASAAETAMHSGYYTTTGSVLSVSLGVREKAELEQEPAVKASDDGNNPRELYEESMKMETVDELLSQRASSALHDDPAETFLLLNGGDIRDIPVAYTAHVSTKGVFIGTCSDASASTRSGLYHGFRLLPHAQIAVTCSSPCAAIVSVPLHRSSDGDGDEAETCAPWVLESASIDADTGIMTEPVACCRSNNNNNNNSSWEGMKEVEEWEKSPSTAATISNNPFADALSSLLTGLPADILRLKLCLVFDDRVARDGFVLSVRGLACHDETIAAAAAAADKNDSRAQDATSSTSSGGGDNGMWPDDEKKVLHARMSCLPWVDPSTGLSVPDAVCQVSAATVEMGQRLNYLELENVVLKKERVDLTARLLRVGGVGGGASSSSSPTSAENGDGHQPSAVLSSEVSELYAQLMVLKANQEKTLIRGQESEARAGSLAAELEQSRARYDALATQYAQTRSALETTESELGSKNEMVLSLKEATARADTQRTEDEQTIGRLTAAVATGRKEVATGAKCTAVLVEDVRARDEQIAMLQERVREQETMIEAVNQRASKLEGQVQAGQEQVARAHVQLSTVQSELADATTAAKRGEQAEKAASEAQLNADSYRAQANVEKKRGEGLSKELKRVMRENAQAVAEFQRALARKSEECNSLYERVVSLEGVTTNNINKLKNSGAGSGSGASGSNVATPEGSVVSSVGDGGSDAGSGATGIASSGASTATETSRMSDSVKRFTSGALEGLGSFASRRGSGSKPATATTDTASESSDK